MRFSGAPGYVEWCFFRMLLDEHELVYPCDLTLCDVTPCDGIWGIWRDENLIAVGLAVETGEIGVRGRTPGDLRDSVGRVTVFWATEVFKASLGRAAARAASIVTEEMVIILTIDSVCVLFLRILLQCVFDRQRQQ